MGYTKVIPIRNSPNKTLKSILYITSDKTPEQTSEIEDYTDYESYEKATEGVIKKTINSYINCSPDPYLADKEMVNIRKKFNKDEDKNLAFHIVQSINKSPDEFAPEKFNEMGVELANEIFNGFQCVVSTHTNTDSLHNHIIINAVNMYTGKKYHDCDATKNLLRQTSDRILEREGLEVLEKTRKFQRYYNTKRDPETHLKTSDYRNTQKYKAQSENKRPALREIVKSDIDLLLPFCKSYDELINKLKGNNYKIRYKKADGSFYEHVTFTPPGRKKGVRDYQIGEEYIRESLAKIIDENNKSREDDFIKWEEEFKKDVNENTVKYSLKDNRYYRFKFDGKYLDELNERYREYVDENELTNYTFRSKDENIIIDDIKTYHEILQEESKGYWKTKKFKNENDKEFENYVWKNKRLKYYFDRLCADNDALQFVEKENISSLKEAVANIELLYKQRMDLDKTFLDLKKAIKAYGEDAVAIEQYRNTIKMIKDNENNPDYPKEKLEVNKMLALNYMERFTAKNIASAKEQNKVLEKYKEYKRRFERLIGMSEAVTEKLKEYRSYMYTMNYINKDERTGKGIFDRELERYEDIKKHYANKYMTKPGNEYKKNENRQGVKEKNSDRSR